MDKPSTNDAPEPGRIGISSIQRLFEIVPDMVCIADVDGFFKYLNREWEIVLGYSPEELFSRPLFDFIHPEDVAATRREIEGQRNGDRTLNFENRCRCRDGSYKNLEWRATPAQGNLLYAVARDVTAQHELHQALVNSESRFRQMFEHIRSGIAIIETVDDGKDFLFKDINPAGARIGGRPREAHIGKRVLGLYPGAADLGILDALQKVSRSGAPITHPASYYQDGQTHLWVAYFVVKLPCGDLMIVYEDVSSRKEVEERSRSLVENTLDGYFICDVISGSFMFLNQRICDLFGYSMEEGLGLTIWDVIDAHEHAAMRRRIKERLADDRPEFSAYVYDAIRKDGSKFRAEVSTSLVTYNGKPVYQGVLRNVTEIERLQQELQQAQKMESVGRLAGGVAHDFNNMLAVIIGNAELAMDQMPSDAPLREHLDEILQAGKRSSDLTRQLLAFARRQTVKPAILDLNETVTEMLMMVRRLIGEDIELAWLPAANLWPIKMDRSQIDQIMANLCVNARDAISGVGKITIRTQKSDLDPAFCARHAGCKPGQYVLLEFTDDGCGMDEETLKHVFEPFFTTKEMGKGTGLGLSMIYGIVKQNDGYIDVRSRPNGGTTFRIFLPRTQDRPAAAELPTEAVPAGTETVLLVEDEPAVLRLAQALLERIGYTVLAFDSPAKAIEAAERHDSPIHLLITDVVMPEMNGQQLKARIETLLPEIKVLFMSGHTTGAIAHRGVLPENVEILQKPFSIRSLALKVREILDERR